MESSISLEETNKIRISLGLKPLVDDGVVADKKEQTAEDNFADRKAKEGSERRTSEIKARLDKKKNQRELNRRLVGTTLGDDDADADDLSKWVKKSKKRQKELAKKRQEELDAMDKMIQEEYTEKDLDGLKVSHDLSALEEGENRILTLRDSRILDNEEDELQNVDLAESEKDARRQELKTKRRDYTGYDDEEFGPGAVAGAKRGVLAKYDEDIDGPSESNFRLGGTSTKAAPKTLDIGTDGQQVNKALLSIDYAKNQEMSDYIQEGDVGFKKPKTKKKRATRRQPDIDPDAPMPPPTTSSLAAGADSMDVDSVPKPDMDANFVDDDDLQAALAKARNRKLAKKKMISGEEMAERLVGQRRAEQEAAANTPEPSSSSTAPKPDVLEFDETSEFVRSVTYTPAPAAVKMEPIVVTINTHADSDSDSEDGDEAITEMDAVKVKVEEGEEEDGEDVEMGEAETDAMLSAIEDAITKSTGGDGGGVEVKLEEGEGQDASIGTANQQTFGSGMAATLNILRQQGLLQGSKAAPDPDREQTQKQKDAWLAQYRHTVAQRELDRIRSRSSTTNKDQSQREWENKQREQAEARETMDLFANYKPDVEIRYHDEHGRALTTKEAWKALSHKFHGKGSGRMKMEKKLKKIAEEKKREAMGSGDTPLSMQAAFQIRQEKAGQAHMVLSVGNRGAVPQASEFLDTPLTKKDAKGKKKKDVTKKDSVADITGFTSARNLPILGGDAIPSSGVSTPTMRSGFTRIGAATDGTASGTPVPEEKERGKVQFGFVPIGGAGTKRKASDGDEDSGSAPKRR